MPRNEDENTSPEVSQKQNNSGYSSLVKMFRSFFAYFLRAIPYGTRFLTFHEQGRKKSFENNQLERAIEVSSKILEDLYGKSFSTLSHSQLSKNKRIPHRYYINGKQTILVILQGDIVKTKVDAIVNAANKHMTGGAGVDGIIHSAAGDQLYDACVAHKQVEKGVRLPTGHSRILLSYNMSRTTYYIINTAGPIYNSYRADECAKDLSSCYRTALALADLYDLESIGFTAISCGIFGYPADDGAKVALETVDKEARSVPVVVFVLWDNHIYDAWVKKAEELNFAQYDPQHETTTNLSSRSMDENQTGATSNTTTDNLTVRDYSTSDKTPKTPDVETKRLINSSPSVPDESSDTQRTEPMDEDDNPTNDKHRSDTVEMKSVNFEQEKSITNDDDAVQQPIQEETGKPDDEKSTINNSPVQENTDKFNDEEANAKTMEDKQHHASAKNNSGDQD